MDRKVEEILEDLYLIEPGLQAEEENLKKTIEELLASRPEGRMDEKFEAELKARLLDEFSRRAKPRRAGVIGLISRRSVKWAMSGAAAAAILLAVFLALNPAGPGAVANGPVIEPLKPIGSVALVPNQAGPKAGGRTRATSPAAPGARTGIQGKEVQGQAYAQPTEEYKGDDTLLQALGVEKGETALPAELDREEAPLAEARRDLASSSIATKDASVRGALPSASKAATAAGVPPSPPAQYQAAAPADKKAKAEAPAEVLANRYNGDFNTEGYDRIVENSFAKVLEDPLSTFSIDVDTASYANVRRFLRSGSLPPPDAVRIEELVNYFPYDYEGPPPSEPFAFNLELSPAPWNSEHSLLRVALQARRIPVEEIPPSNLVFLIDVSGSMQDENKLPLVKESLKLLARRMRSQDRISIAVYAGSAGLVLEPTPGNKTERILKAIDALESGGSTAGSEGIRLAYEEAKRGFIKGGSNRVILATDGDFNVGPSSDGELVRLIEEERKAGIFLTVLGFGMGNYQDFKMQKLADTGNGNYAYVDSLAEADKVLSRQMAGTLFTVAKDVKVQIEFNPALVGEYRLIGYEKRALAARDFADDSKDAGELGAGSSVTALYELVPPSGSSSRTDLRYQGTAISPEGAKAEELLTLKFRYKKPDGTTSSLIEKPMTLASRDFGKCSTDFRFAAAVAEWGLILRNSSYKGSATVRQVLSIARDALGRDSGGYRAEFLELVSRSGKLLR